MSQQDIAAPTNQDPAHQHELHDSNGFTPPSRDASGTAWLPDETPMYAIHARANGWTLMGHGTLFLEYLHESGSRGHHQAGAINWVMGMADRTLGSGHLGLRAMASLEPWTIRGCGYPNLLASGEVCQGGTIHDRQHPHDLWMELAARYDFPLSGGVRLQAYGGPVGEPALGPVAFPHRVSALSNAVAPITHHWFDATHITYGVITGGVYSNLWKAEASAFNGREPDERRTNLDLAALDSWSGRFWFLPTKRWAFQVSGGRLTEAEPGPDGEARIDIDRLTASATYHRALRPGSIWASTVGWGHNAEPDGDATNALFVETSFALNERGAWFARLELSQKTAHDLDVERPDVFSVAKVQSGYARHFADWNSLKSGVGGSVSLGIVPGSLQPVYGSRINVGFGLFVNVRPSEHRM